MRTHAQFDPKCVSLRQHATLNPHPEQVSDALFQMNLFFDPRDLLQVKYEMLRRVVIDGQPIGTTAAAFGFSRHHALSTPQTLRGGWFGWTTPSTQGASSSSQTVRRYPDLYPANPECRARTAHCKPVVTREPALWDIHPSAQYPTCAGQAAKKRLPDHETSQPLCPASPRSGSECLARYEILRRQVLEFGDDPHPNGLELAFIERQGLAAWMEYGPDSPPSNAVSDDLQMSGPGEVETSNHALVLALADLVLGDRQEAQDGRSD